MELPPEQVTLDTVAPSNAGEPFAPIKTVGGVSIR